LKTPIAVTIAGSDSGGGAGIQADLKTFSALGVYGATVIAALTAQNTRGVSSILDVTPEFIAAQMDAVYSDLVVDATKIGMLSCTEAIEAVAEGLNRHKVQNIVLDPVMVATSGDLLLEASAIETLKRKLIPHALVVTPNLPEAAALLGVQIARDETEMEKQGRAILTFGAKAVLMKGGHSDGTEALDLLISPEGVRKITARLVNTRNTHGTGCTLSSAIAAGLATGVPLNESVAAAKKYVTAAIEASDQLKIGSGHGPVHHFHALWDRAVPKK
jgi:hydroxymethylpyrimidine/phosphomethylpyrimidine kinase